VRQDKLEAVVFLILRALLPFIVTKWTKDLIHSSVEGVTLGQRVC
jgi:hypothetical protein